eukprot:m.8874 g.8874  ORF g.8874 m.8874 type:complete len:269 (+) comp6774_c0_seq1:6-812(+)
MGEVAIPARNQIQTIGSVRFTVDSTDMATSPIQQVVCRLIQLYITLICGVAIVFPMEVLEEIGGKEAVDENVVREIRFLGILYIWGALMFYILAGDNTSSSARHNGCCATIFVAVVVIGDSVLRLLPDIQGIHPHAVSSAHLAIMFHSLCLLMALMATEGNFVLKRMYPLKSASSDTVVSLWILGVVAVFWLALAVTHFVLTDRLGRGQSFTRGTLGRAILHSQGTVAFCNAFGAVCVASSLDTQVLRQMSYAAALWVLAYTVFVSAV